MNAKPIDLRAIEHRVLREQADYAAMEWGENDDQIDIIWLIALIRAMRKVLADGRDTLMDTAEILDGAPVETVKRWEDWDSRARDALNLGTDE